MVLMSSSEFDKLYEQMGNNGSKGRDIDPTDFIGSDEETLFVCDACLVKSIASDVATIYLDTFAQITQGLRLTSNTNGLGLSDEYIASSAHEIASNLADTLIGTIANA